MRKAVRQKVNLKTPVRADIAGAFSDLAYYLEKYNISHGAVANVSLPVYLNISAFIDDENASLKVEMPDLGFEVEGDLEDLRKQENDNVSQIIIHFITLFNLDSSGLNIVVTSEGKIPPASGLGTSSAVGVGVISALAQLYGLYGVNPCELNYIVELAMGIMGGKQDYYAAWLTGLNFLEFSGPGKSLVSVREHLKINSKQYMWLRENIMVYYSGKSRSSGVANAEPEKKVESDPAIIERIAAVASSSWLAIKEMNSKSLAESINLDRNNRLELTNRYYTHEMKLMGAAAESLGFAHRACGAGMGGCMLFFGDPKMHSKFEEVLKRIGGWKVC